DELGQPPRLRASVLVPARNRARVSPCDVQAKDQVVDRSRRKAREAWEHGILAWTEHGGGLLARLKWAEEWQNRMLGGQGRLLARRNRPADAWDGYSRRLLSGQVLRRGGCGLPVLRGVLRPAGLSPRERGK